jgi:hypothetical protein
MAKHLPPFIDNLWNGAGRSKNRRQAPRYSPTRDLELCLGWKEGEEYHYSSAKLANISVAGALVLPTALPPVGQPFWLRIDDPRCQEWIEATIVEAKDSLLGQKTLRLAFRESCPYSFFKAAVSGFNAQNGYMTTKEELKHPEWW